MSLRRRDFLKGVAGGGLLLLGSTGEALAREHKTLGDKALGLLYDGTRCIGCKACVAGCKQANDRPPEHTSPDGLWDDPVDLSADTWNIIKMHKEGDKFWFVKRQCMHCIEPACVSACPVSALQKQPETGIVTYDKGACIGCRYCQVACPFLIPRFEWKKPFPVIAKCNLCLTSRLEKGGEPGCTTACPTGAVIFGKTKELLAEARGRIKGEPGRYVDRIYGETEAGGTQVLYLSAIPFEKLGLPALGPDSPSAFSEGIQHGIYRYMAAPAAVLGILSWLAYRNIRRGREAGRAVQPAPGSGSGKGLVPGEVMADGGEVIEDARKDGEEKKDRKEDKPGPRGEKA